MDYIRFPEVSLFAPGYLFMGFSLSTVRVHSTGLTRQRQAGGFCLFWLPTEKRTGDGLRW